MLTQAFRDIAVILVLAVFIYLPFLGSLEWAGHEPLRINISKEILETNSWIKTTLHGQPYFIKPPLFNWLVASCGKLFGTINEWTSRLPSAAAMILTALTVYFVSGQALSRNGRFVAALATISMTGLIKKARTAEIDSLFVFFVTISLLVWIYAYRRKVRPIITWSIPLAILGIGFLTKGPHAVTFFYFTVFTFLLLKKDLRYFFSPAHIGGFILMLAVVAVYVLAVLQHISWQEYAGMWIDQITSRAEGRKSHAFVKHFFDFPLGAVMSFMPWILLIIPAFFSRKSKDIFRQLLSNDLIFFSIVMITVNFPLYWLLPNAYVRYFLPAGPFIAIILAGSAERYLSQRQQTGTPSGMTLRKLSIMVSLVVGICLHIYTAAIMYRAAQDVNTPKKIAAEIEQVIPSDVNTLYEIGAARLLEDITCNLKRKIIQVETFRDLEKIHGEGQAAYVMHDRDVFNASGDEEKWEKLYARKVKYVKSGELIVSRLVRAPAALH